MHIVFLGNCQAGALSSIVQRFVSPYLEITTDFVDAYNSVDAASLARVKRADVVVAQASTGTPALGIEHVPAGIPVHLVPVVSGAFLYPYQGVVHPAQPTEAAGTIPFQAEYSDRYLAKLYMAKVEPAEALRQYRAFDVATAAAVGRLYEITLEAQRKLDSATGYACADLIERHLGEEQLFQSAFHFSGRIAAHLAAPLCDRLGFDPKYGQRIRDHLRDAPFVRLFVPVHPSIARYFGMRWVTDETRYPYRFEGSFTFDEYVTRFMQVRWSEAMQAGVLAANSREPGAKALLETGLGEAPRSAEGPHALSRILEEEGDLQGAIALQRRAASVALDAEIPFRLGDLLRRAGDLHGAEQAFRHAIELDPVGHPAWSALSAVLEEAGNTDAARNAARLASIYAPGPVRPTTPVRAPAPAAIGAPAGSTAEIVAHIQNQGDTLSDLQGLAGTPGSKRAIEGFMILDDPAASACGLTYQSVRADMSLSAPAMVGAYCGTRGENTPIYGLRICVDATAAEAAHITYEAWFVDGVYFGPMPAGTVCQSASRAPLEAFRLTFAAARAQDA
jgi:tetratricopeptide (TPR) repeat protein